MRNILARIARAFAKSIQAKKNVVCLRIAYPQCRYPGPSHLGMVWAIGAFVKKVLDKDPDRKCGCQQPKVAQLDS